MSELYTTLVNLIKYKASAYKKHAEELDEKDLARAMFELLAEELDALAETADKLERIEIESMYNKMKTEA